MVHPGMRGAVDPKSPLPPPQVPGSPAAGQPQEEGRQWQSPGGDSVGASAHAQEAQAATATAGGAKA